jgi:competence ComEA-like helix-hairpin-helix protein
LPYVTIEQKKSEYSKPNPDAVIISKQASYVPKTFEPVDINSADTTPFIALPGIGAKLAQRIIKFRDKLGGFYSIDQVAETFGLPDSTYQKIKPRLIIKNTTVKKNKRKYCPFQRDESPSLHSICTCERHYTISYTTR